MNDEIWVIDSPIAMIEGESIVFAVEFIGATTVEVPSSEVYKNGAAYSDQVQISGDRHQISGRSVVLKKITAKAGDGGATYIVVVSATVDGNDEKRKLKIRVVDPGEE